MSVTLGWWLFTILLSKFTFTQNSLAISSKSNKKALNEKPRESTNPTSPTKQNNNENRIHTILGGDQSRLDSVPNQAEEYGWSIREVSPDEDPEYWASSPWRRRATRLSNITGSAPVLLFLWLFYLQVQCFLDIHSNSWELSLEVVVVGISLYIEVLRIALGIVDCLCRLLAAVFHVWRPRYRLVGDDVPRVDVIITCCNESLDIVQDTVLGALALDYPENCFRVILTDDGASPALKEWAVGLKSSNLFYTARVKEGPAGYKAGNLNHAVEFIKTLLGSPASFIAGLDADMIPEKRWLRAVLPHLLLDTTMGVATPKQCFYNVPTNDPIFQSNKISWAVTDIVRDSLDCAWNSGSGYVLRRAALEDIGGFSMGSVTEDVYSSMMMLSKGWKSAYLAESLQFGLVPSSYLGHIKQQTRWNIGGIQLGLNFGFYLSNSHTGRLNFKQRLCGFWSLTSAYRHILDIVELFIMPTFLFGHSQPHHKLETLNRFARVSCIASLTHWLHDCGRGWIIGYRTALRESGLQLYMAPYYVISITRSFVLPRGLGGTEPGFKATGSIADSMDERCASRRAPLRRRIKHTVFGCGVWVHVLLIIYYMSYILSHMRRIVLQAATTHASQQGRIESQSMLWMEIAWLAPRLLKVLATCLTPLRYMCFPPNDPARDELLGKREEKTGARYPKDSARSVKWASWSILDFEAFYSVMTVFNMCLLFRTYGM
ncbi:glycosyltransferase family 2 protein [Hypoxylon sp. FL1857]|nr:glycosyltransferase family 2 protein [Hypoxylon sp. FL1857]